MTQAKIPKLSPAMKEVVLKMRDGWQLGKSNSYHVHCWIQKGGIGKGGESQNVNIGTWAALIDRKLIFESQHKYPSSPYELTDLGKQIDL
jgi:hypothetical protein